MRLTEEQFNALAPYEKHFESMVKAKWSRYPGSAALDLIHAIHCKVIGRTYKLNKGCSNCIGDLLTDMGKIYIADRFERMILNGIEISPEEIHLWSKLGIPLDVMTKTIIVGNSVVEKKVAIKGNLTAEPVKVEVKTKRKYTRKPKA